MRRVDVDIVRRLSVGERTDCCRVTRAFEVPRARRMQPASDGRASAVGEQVPGWDLSRASPQHSAAIASRAATEFGAVVEPVSRGPAVRCQPGTSGVVAGRGAGRHDAGSRGAAAMDGRRRRIDDSVAFCALMCSRGSLPFADGSPERCAGRILENVALCFSRTGTLRRLTTLSSPFGDPEMACAFSMEIPRSAAYCGWSRYHAYPFPLPRFANRFGAGSVGSDSSSGACAPPDTTAATPHLRVRNPSQTAPCSELHPPQRRIMNRTHRPGAPPAAGRPRTRGDGGDVSSGRSPRSRRPPPSPGRRARDQRRGDAVAPDDRPATPPPSRTTCDPPTGALPPGRAPHPGRALDERPAAPVLAGRRLALLLPLQRRLPRGERHRVVPRDIHRPRALARGGRRDREVRERPRRYRDGQCRRRHREHRRVRRRRRDRDHDPAGRRSAAPIALRLDRRRIPLRVVRRQSRDGQPGPRSTGAIPRSSGTTPAASGSWCSPRAASSACPRTPT